MLLNLKLINVNELMEMNIIEDVNFEFISLPFTDAGLSHVMQELGVDDPSDLGIIEFQSDCLNIDVCGDDDIILLNEMIKYIDEELNDAEDYCSMLDEINDSLESGVLNIWDF
jgi:hypothetical protein